MRIVYRPREDTTPASELSTLAAVYKFVLDCRTKIVATRPGSSDAAKEIKNDSRHRHRST